MLLGLVQLNHYLYKNTHMSNHKFEIWDPCPCVWSPYLNLCVSIHINKINLFPIICGIYMTHCKCLAFGLIWAYTWVWGPLVLAHSTEVIPRPFGPAGLTWDLWMMTEAYLPWASHFAVLDIFIPVPAKLMLNCPYIVRKKNEYIKYLRIFLPGSITWLKLYSKGLKTSKESWSNFIKRKWASYGV